MSRSSRGAWLCHVFSVLPGVAVAALCALGVLREGAALALLSLSFIGLNLAHMSATWSRVYFDPRALRGAWVERLLVPALLLVFATLGEAVGLGATLLAAQYFLSLHHAMMQNYGIARATQRDTARRLSPRALRLDQAACLLLPFGAAMHRAREVSARYASALLPAAPAWLSSALMALGALALALYLLRELRALRRGETVDALGPALIASQCVLWTGLPLWISHPALPLYALASGHYVQYLYFVWRSEQRRPSLVALPATVHRFVAPPARLPYFGGLLALGGLGVLGATFASVALRSLAATAGLRPATALPIAPWVAAMIGVNLSHYWLDHRIWRARSTT